MSASAMPRSYSSYIDCSVAKIFASNVGRRPSFIVAWGTEVQANYLLPPSTPNASISPSYSSIVIGSMLP
jgi:hypothetical protein